MPLTFPLSLAAFFDTIPNARCVFSLVESDNVSEGASGELLARGRGQANWRATVTIGMCDIAEHDRIRAMVHALRGPRQRFRLRSSAHSAPLSDPDGAALASSTVTVASVAADRQSLALQGLPANFALAAGDMLSVAWSGRVALFEFAEAVTANGSGVTALAQVSPAVHAGISAGAAVSLAPASGLFQMDPGSWREGSPSGRMMSGAGFTARMVFA